MTYGNKMGLAEHCAGVGKGQKGFVGASNASKTREESDRLLKVSGLVANRRGKRRRKGLRFWRTRRG